MYVVKSLGLYRMARLSVSLAFWATVCKTVRPILSVHCLSVCPVQSVCRISAHVYCGQTAGWIKTVLGMEVGLSPGDFVLDGDPDPSPKRGRSPLFSAHVYCGHGRPSQLLLSSCYSVISGNLQQSCV